MRERLYKTTNEKVRVLPLAGEETSSPLRLISKSEGLTGHVKYAIIQHVVPSVLVLC